MTPPKVDVNRCRKCGSEQLLGPRFTRGKHGEHLRWSCRNCGFCWSTPPLDAEAAR